MFESVTDAVLCAMAAQKNLAEWNEPRPVARRMVLRVGVNLGDIFLQADGLVYGDGVNVAARLQTFAEPGGICVSEMVRVAVGNKLPAVFDSLGEQKFKNIAVPISVYGARLIPDASLPDPPTRSALRNVLKRWAMATLNPAIDLAMLVHLVRRIVVCHSSPPPSELLVPRVSTVRTGSNASFTP